MKSGEEAGKSVPQGLHMAFTSAGNHLDAGGCQPIVELALLIALFLAVLFVHGGSFARRRQRPPSAPAESRTGEMRRDQ